MHCPVLTKINFDFVNKISLEERLIGDAKHIHLRECLKAGDGAWGCVHYNRHVEKQTMM
jgi:hypothetical protein